MDTFKELLGRMEMWILVQYLKVETESENLICRGRKFQVEGAEYANDLWP